MEGGADTEISLVASAKEEAAEETQMLGIRDWLQIRRLEKSRAWTSKQYHIEIEALKKAGASRDKIDQRQDDARFEDKTYRNQIEDIRTRDLLSRASHYKLPLPNRDDEEAWDSIGIIFTPRILLNFAPPFGMSKCSVSKSLRGFRL